MKRRAAIHFLTKTCLYICGAMSATDPHISKHSYTIIVYSHSKVLHETVRLATVNELLLSASAWFCTFLCLGVRFSFHSQETLGAALQAWRRHATPLLLGFVSLLAGAWLKGVGAASPLNLPGKLASEAAIFACWKQAVEIPGRI